MVVTSRCVALRVLITQARILKRFWVENLDKFTLFSHFLVGWNLENLQKHAVSIFVRWSWHFKREKPVFWKACFFAKEGQITRTSFVYKTSRLVWIYLLISALNKRVLLLSSGKLFYKSNRKLIPCVCISRYKHERGWENSQQLCIVFILGYANTENVFYCLNTKYK